MLEVAENLQVALESTRRSKFLNDEKSIFTDHRSGIMIVSCSVDDSGTILHANQRMGMILGYDTHQLVGESVSMITPEPFASGHWVSCGRLCSRLW